MSGEKGSRLVALRLTGQEYRLYPADADGKYRTLAFPELALRPDFLWDRAKDWQGADNPFQIERALPRLKLDFAEGGIAWGDLPFDAAPELTPKRLSFAEFAAWTPQATFESSGNKPVLGGVIGSRNVIGMLLRTEGLTQAVTVLHPREWIDALILAEEDRLADAARRTHWWEVARQAAALLREQFGFGRLVVIGDLVEDRPLNVWSDITLVAFDRTDVQDSWEAYREMRRLFRDEAPINLLENDRATQSERHAIAVAGVEIYLR
jgi:hypothetical protein